MSYTALNGGYPTTDPYRDFERRECRQIEFESARESNFAGRAVDENGFVIGDRNTAPTTLADIADASATDASTPPPCPTTIRQSGQFRPFRTLAERLRHARWASQVAAENRAEHLRLNRELCEAFDVPGELQMLSVSELWPEVAGRFQRQ